MILGQIKVRKILRAQLILLILSGYVGLCAVQNVHADWIKGYFAPNAGIDSVNRFLVIRDDQDSTFLGRTIVSAGDVNGDWIADMIACRSKIGAAKDDSSFLFLGGKPPNGAAFLRFGNLKWSVSNLGDLNSDGFDDFGQMALYPELPKYQVFWGGNKFDDTADVTILSVTWPTLIARAVDLDGDGNLELALIAHIDSNCVKIFQATPVFDTVSKYVIRDTSRDFGSNLEVGDFNGDGYPDLAVAGYYNRADPFVKFYWGGPQFDTISDFTIKSTSPQFGRTLRYVGDFNADGYGDYLICGAANERYGVYFGGPTVDTTLDVVIDWDGYLSYNPPTSSTVGDFNHDGHPDVLVTYQDISPVTSYFEMFLGGTSVDSTVDIHVNGGNIGGFSIGLGQQIANVGDFNGDGVDDFALSTRTASCCYWWAELHLFAGWNSTATDVSGPIDNELPYQFDLHQNYPNPFNPSTTIEYELSKPSRVTLVIYNSLGQQVRTLVDQPLGVGAHRVQWDGKDDEGNAMPSGVYVYRLVAGDSRQERKMVLVR